MPVCRVAAFVFCIISLWISDGFGQEIKRNYLITPEHTDCDSLLSENYSEESAIELVRNTKHRFSKKFRLTRTSGLQAGEYYSCDVINGFMIIKYDNAEYLYSDVQKEDWDNMVSDPDPEAYFLKMRDSLVRPKSVN